MLWEMVIIGVLAVICAYMARFESLNKIWIFALGTIVSLCLAVGLLPATVGLLGSMVGRTASYLYAVSLAGVMVLFLVFFQIVCRLIGYQDEVVKYPRYLVIPLRITLSLISALIWKCVIMSVIASFSFSESLPLVTPAGMREVSSTFLTKTVQIVQCQESVSPRQKRWLKSYPEWLCALHSGVIDEESLKEEQRLNENLAPLREHAENMEKALQ